MIEPAVVAVGHGDQLHAWNLQRDSGISLPLPAGANQRDLNMVVSRHRLKRAQTEACASAKIFGPINVCAVAVLAIFRKLLRLNTSYIPQRKLTAGQTIVFFSETFQPQLL